MAGNTATSLPSSPPSSPPLPARLPERGYTGGVPLRRFSTAIQVLNPPRSCSTRHPSEDSRARRRPHSSDAPAWPGRGSRRDLLKSTGRGVSRDPLSIDVLPPQNPLALSLLPLLFLPTTHRTHCQRPFRYLARSSLPSRSFSACKTSSESPHRRTVHGAQTKNTVALRGGRRLRTLVTPLLP